MSLGECNIPSARGWTLMHEGLKRVWQLGDSTIGEKPHPVYNRSGGKH